MLNHSSKSATINRSSPLAAPKCNIQCLRLIYSIPPGPAPPESRPATSVTVSPVISMEMSSSGQSGYDFILADVGGRALGCLVRRNSINISPVFVHRSAGLITPPVSLSVIHRTAVNSFPRSTRLCQVLALYSRESFLWAAVRYCVHVRRVSSSNILWLFTFSIESGSIRHTVLTIPRRLIQFCFII